MFRNISSYFMATASNSHIIYNLLKNVTSVCNRWEGSHLNGMFFFQQMRQEPENSKVLNYQLKPKGGRRRWGHVTGSCKGEDMDDYEETDLTALSILGKSKSSADKSRQGENGRGR